MPFETFKFETVQNPFLSENYIEHEKWAEKKTRVKCIYFIEAK